MQLPEIKQDNKRMEDLPWGSAIRIRSGGMEMSIHVMSMVFKHSQATLGSRLVLLAIADNANDHGLCWPSVNLLAEKSLMSERNVQYALQKLIELGEFEITRRYRETNVYRIKLKGVDGADFSGEKTDSSMVQESTEIMQDFAPKPSVNHQENHTPLPPTGEERGGVQSSSGNNQQPMAQSNRGAHETPARPGVYKEIDNPWWTPERLQHFDVMYDNYPKKSPKIEAMVALRLAMEQQSASYEEILKGLEWWWNKWHREGTEERFIPNMGRWFERRSWEQAG
jgi:hypothetical protein